MSANFSPSLNFANYSHKYCQLSNCPDFKTGQAKRHILFLLFCVPGCGYHFLWTVNQVKSIAPTWNFALMSDDNIYQGINAQTRDITIKIAYDID